MLNKAKLCEPMEEPALLIKHRRKSDARARFLQEVSSTEQISGSKKGYTRMESLTQSTHWPLKARWGLVEINKEQ